MAKKKRLVIGTLDQDAIQRLADCGVDPVSELAKYALGDVVGLGLLTQEELDEEEIYDEDGLVVQESGQSKALKLIPTKLRAEILKDLLGYIHARPKQKEKADAAVGAGKFVFYMPSNGRDKTGLAEVAG